MKMIGVFILVILQLFASSGCTSNESYKAKATVWIMGGPGQDSCLFEIKDDNSIKIISGNVYFDDTKQETILGTETQTKTIKPNLKNTEAINDLLSKISEKDEDIVTPYNDVIEIHAEINGKKYWTPFFEDGHANKDLLALTYKLIELSPIKVGGEHNPIKVPKQN